MRCAYPVSPCPAGIATFKSPRIITHLNCLLRLDGVDDAGAVVSVGGAGCEGADDDLSSLRVFADDDGGGVGEVKVRVDEEVDDDDELCSAFRVLYTLQHPQSLRDSRPCPYPTQASTYL